jgi:hypothetical protein
MIDVGKEWKRYLEMYDECITLHPAFKEVCLSTWVLEIAAIGLNSKDHKSCTSQQQQHGKKTESE